MNRYAVSTSSTAYGSGVKSWTGVEGICQPPRKRFSRLDIDGGYRRTWLVSRSHYVYLRVPLSISVLLYIEGIGIGIDVGKSK